MAFNFNWSPLAADASFYQRARDLLTTALNKTPKPPIIVDDIIVTEFNLGSVPPDLEILEIGDIAADRFRGIFKMCYTGDAFLTLKTRVQANPLNTYLSSKPSFTSPEPLAAASSLTIPLQITLSEIKLSAFIIVVFSKQKGLTLVFRNDPLESLKVSSTFDSIQFVRDYLQRTIEGKLRDLMMNELPAIIHRLSLQLWSPDQAPKEDSNATADDDGEVRVNPLADVPPDAVDAYGNPIDAGEISSLSTTGSPETQSLFSQKNLVRLAALTNSHRTLSLFTPGIREVVFRAWTRPVDRQDANGSGGTGSSSSPPFSTPNLARYNSYTAAATSTTATTTTYTFSDTGSQVHGHLPARPSMVSMGSVTTGLSLGANHSRHSKAYGGARKKKTRVVNLRKSSDSSSSSSKAPIGVGAPVSEVETGSDSVSVQGALSEPILPASIPEENELEVQPELATGPPGRPGLAGLAELGQPAGQGVQAQTAAAIAIEPVTSIGATLAAAGRAPDQKAPETAEAAVPRAMVPGFMHAGGVLEAALADEKRRSQAAAVTAAAALATSTRPGIRPGTRSGARPNARPPQTAQNDSSTVVEKEWIMKMASEIARRVYDENRKNPTFWDEAPPPADQSRQQSAISNQQFCCSRPTLAPAARRLPVAVRLRPQLASRLCSLPTSTSSLEASTVASSDIQEAIGRRWCDRGGACETMAPTSEKKADRATLLSSINPWGASRRNASPARGSEAETPSVGVASGPGGIGAVAAAGATGAATVLGLGSTSGPTMGSGAATPSGGVQDHSISPFYGRSIREYPAGCPLLNVQWFHAVDVPKRKAEWFKGKKAVAKDGKPPPRPKKYVAFSISDSRSIETAYQAVLEKMEDSRRTSGAQAWGTRRRSPSSRRDTADSGDLGDMGMEGSDVDGLGRGQTGQPGSRHGRGVKVPVNEDFLFDVNVEDRELTPVYWLGPVYDVRRGSWFYQEGSTLRPCEENLAAQLEEGYLKVRPWQYASESLTEDAGGPGGSSSSGGSGGPGSSASTPPLTSATTSTTAGDSSQLQTHRLFGQYMNHVATYQDATTAWLSTDGMLSWVTSTVYERFSGGGFMSGVKLVRGYSEPKKAKEAKEAKETKETKDAKDGKEKQQQQQPTGGNATDEKRAKALKRRSAPPSIQSERSDGDIGGGDDAEAVSEVQFRGKQLLSSLMGGGGKSSRSNSSANVPEAQEEEIRKREEKEIQDDYNGQSGETQGREIEHLVLVTHGIGQLLGIRMESLDFIHDVNMLRKTLKAVYAGSPSLRALNSELPGGPGNCRIQVLPVCWRHILDFPKRNEGRQQTQDLGDMNEEEDSYPALEDITIEGMAFARSLISDLALDVLLFQSSYRDQISEIVVREANRIYRLFRERNPGFKGTVHAVGHSLGSAILFDIFCRQRDDRTVAQSRPGSGSSKQARDLSLAFDVEDFYCLGSPVGLFQMLEGRTIAARPESSDGGTKGGGKGRTAFVDLTLNESDAEPRVVSSPRVSQLFNVFHPSDPISYRLEPLISPPMASLKPQVLPYTKRGLFGSVAPQGLTGIGAKVGQSVSGLWSSLSAGIASNLLNRSLGFSQEDVAKLGQEAGGAAAVSPGGDVALVDGDVETLYSHFQKKRASLKGEDATTGSHSSQWLAEEAKAQRMRREEAKVRALNRNGRVDYSIQESVLDFNPINTIASHMAYWADEDVSHFIMSQVLSHRARPTRKRKNQHAHET
ncbi:ddhd domain containing protein [Grosmannia clavigera kw1407]|uniref:Mitochondrial distribution and morphology protein 34 n=1 Tax=Grosmannia clavigera (strain kw1407 / UAMH 11150) TaxID=655863 RepID=F0XSI4_GROCL|nr:ddhd domain containing protein [Grosmannia clavigera kw1407]EFW99148.1 ddhd domain containing protein [Grosmannia clavigera kw1407]